MLSVPVALSKQWFLASVVAESYNLSRFTRLDAVTPDIDFTSLFYDFDAQRWSE